ncbi:hypothetical protein C8N43_0540 [Litoreibacter ponti]|uniref:Phosphatidate cytidylyltransferase n=1 Tax=Litoreibacter ponti TaxID=1510457 RepID=A0A2T6BIL2_9RHOB|nr:UDP-2,3-diacylglucosamine diphosphatase LpxI [Litoreibacter ponti]PTX55892.1 hypothetical protein C8N43_0540 [Litoreibacter ponti]
MFALVAGEGALPGVLIRRLEAEGRPFRYCEMEGHSSDARGDRPMMRFRVETLGSFINDLRSVGVDQICFAGRVARPRLDPSAIDSATMPLVPRMMAALQAGDDGALRLVLGFFEEAGIEIIAAHDLAPDLIPDAGAHGIVKPSDQDKRDADRGVEIIGAMAKVDVGQACIVAGGQALAIEAAGGTDWMMRSLMVRPKGVGHKALTNDNAWDDPIGLAADWLTGTGEGAPGVDRVRDPDLPQGGLLVKAAKPGQDRRVDMPTIGPLTFLRAAEVGLRGVVIEAGGVMVLEFDRCVEIADRQNLLFWVRE